ncbi:hypothetical protein OUZ56_012426 [Daphnia magna]|uniref:Uncharacterized protein n=1 Tax=Daphnia magna TaxID=35525 RepID=A0ABQ9Z2Z1_9CRUS|nr:hypothetical protein OUZ56_012426 [Daphnia magna]
MIIKLTVSEVIAIETKYQKILNFINAFSYQRFGLNSGKTDYVFKKSQNITFVIICDHSIPDLQC